MKIRRHEDTENLATKITKDTKMRHSVGFVAAWWVAP